MNEPADKVPFPNSSRMISERSVQFLKAKETWLRSIMKADCSCSGEQGQERTATGIVQQDLGDRFASLYASENWFHVNRLSLQTIRD